MWLLKFLSSYQIVSIEPDKITPVEFKCFKQVEVPVLSTTWNFSTFTNVINSITINKGTKINIYLLVLTLGIPDCHSHCPPFILEVVKCLPIETLKQYIHFIKLRYTRNRGDCRNSYFPRPSYLIDLEGLTNVSSTIVPCFTLLCYLLKKTLIASSADIAILQQSCLFFLFFLSQVSKSINPVTIVILLCVFLVTITSLQNTFSGSLLPKNKV